MKGALRDCPATVLLLLCACAPTPGAYRQASAVPAIEEIVMTVNPSQLTTQAWFPHSITVRDVECPDSNCHGALIVHAGPNIGVHYDPATDTWMLQSFAVGTTEKVQFSDALGNSATMLVTTTACPAGQYCPN